MSAINPYVACFVVLLIALIQTQFLPALLPGITQFVPDLLLLVVVSWSLLLEEQWALPVAFGAGLFLDLLAPGLHPIGFNALLFSLIAALITLTAPNRSNTTVIRAVPVALLGAGGYHLAGLLADRILGYNNFQPNVIFQILLPLIIIDAALMLVMFGLVRLVTRVKTARE